MYRDFSVTVIIKIRIYKQTRRQRFSHNFFTSNNRMNCYRIFVAALTMMIVVSSSFADIDTTGTVHIQDSLAAAQKKHLDDYRLPPVSSDTPATSVDISRYALFSSNAAGIAELSRLTMQQVYTPVTLSSNLNRSMLYGFPLLPTEMQINSSLPSLSYNALRGFDRIAATEVQDYSIAPPDKLMLNVHPSAAVIPETEIFWENGVFYENTLNVRFVRPLSNSLSLGVFSNNRFFKSENYTTATDIKSMYNYFFTDTTMLVQGGKNPLVNEHETSIRLVSTGKNGEQRYVSFSYNDTKNETSFEHTTTGGQTSLMWDKIVQYGSCGTAGLTGLNVYPVKLDVETRFTSGGNARYIADLDTGYKGKNSELSVAVHPFIPLSGDTAAFTGIIAQNTETMYSDSERSAYNGSLALSYASHTHIGAKAVDFSASIGQRFQAITNGQNNNDWVWSGTAALRSTHATLSAYAARAALPYPVLFDTAGLPSDIFFKLYNTYGAELFAWYGNVGIITGINGVSGLDSSSAAGYWLHGVLPYQQQHMSWTIAPVLTEWHSLSLSSRWTLSSSRPYVTSQTILSVRAHPLKEHILVDCIFDYWSKRDNTSYAGISGWNREIFNLSLRTTLQVKTFCLYSKIDNILNRKYAYVPGYWMPGMTFRWGFHWLIPG
jgi:hypothetical protein